MKLNPSDQERKKAEEQFINHNKDNTNTNKINDKSEISIKANCINNNFENINNSAMKDTGNKKEVVNKNFNIESNKQIKEKTEKVIRNVSENYKIAPLVFSKC